MRPSIFKLVVLLIAVWIAAGECNAQGLKMNFYQESCPLAELIVKTIIQRSVLSNPALPAKFLRMHFHDCFVRGCDASILLDTVDNNAKAEKEAVPNLSLSGFDVIDYIKTQIELLCPNTVSCADILALAARDSVSFLYNWPLWDVPTGRREGDEDGKERDNRGEKGGRISQFINCSLWEVPTGRRDGRISLASDVIANIPSPFSDFNTLMQLFNRKGLNLTDLVLLSGGHTIGVAHCATFSPRLYNFSGHGDQDPSLDPSYAEFLKKRCPNPANPATIVAMDPKSALTFDKHYYQTLLENKGLFVSDAALLTNSDSAKIVGRLHISNSFIPQFANSMKKMGAIEVLTGTAGEIRKQCRVVN
ncbi:hypothetical protein SLEP1_g232 [Rubroshorea leprosula]|uniref:Peroxidase n=1 Tax=Rubroshorea leprosula TaxID=152421 RepID=A0AAV5HIJ6_9ROSI|nr:hypothetical protein SLEP1_g232 [Rubroshorea leprosula]